LITGDPAVFSLPPILGLFGDFDLADGFLDGRSFGGQAFDLAKLPDDLLGRVVLLQLTSKQTGISHQII